MYQLLKAIHVLAVILFLGNIITGLFWKRHADGTNDRAIIAHTLRGIIRADNVFTGPSILFLLTFGILAALRVGLPILGTGWILWSIVLFALSGVAFGWKVAPLQKQMLRICEADAEMDWPLYRAKSLEWELWGVFATLAPIGAVALMTVKPAL